MSNRVQAKDENDRTVQGEYNATPPSYTDGDVVVPQYDSKGRALYRSPDEKVIYESDASFDYYGFAPAGSSLGSAVWRVFRIAKSDGVTKTHADGNEKYDNVGSSLVSLTYS